MPSYTITDPNSGRKLTLTGDSAPTEEEVEALFSSPMQRDVDKDTGYVKGNPPKLSGKKLAGARLVELLNGTLAGWGDELTGVIGGLAQGASTGEFTRGYDEATSRSRNTVNQYEQERPLEALGINAAGMIPAIGLGGASAVAKSTLPAKMLSAARSGAGWGAVAGAGYADGDASDRAIGGIEGGIIGGLLAPLAPAVPAAYRGVKRMVDRARLSPEQFAANFLSKSLERDAITTGDATRFFNDTPGGALIDLGREATTAAGEQSALSTQGRVTAERFFEQADKESTGKMGKAVKDLVADKPFYDVLDENTQKRIADATPLYQKAYAAQYRRTPRLVALSKKPAVGAAAKAAITRVLNDPDMVDDEVRSAIGAVFGNDLDKLSDVQAAQRLTQALGARPIEFKVFDYIKRGLDVLAENPETAKEIKKLRRAWREELKLINPSYQDALDAWAGPSATIDALNEGRKFHLMDHEEISREMADMSASEREAFQVGVSRALMDRINNQAEGDVTSLSKYLTRPEVQRKLEAVLGTTGLSADNLLASNNWKKGSDGIYRSTSKPGQELSLAADGTWELTQSSKTGKSTKRTGTGADALTLEAMLTGKTPAPKNSTKSVDDLVLLAQRILDTQRKEATVTRGSQTARRMVAAKELDDVGPLVDTITAAASGGKSLIFNKALESLKGRALEGLSEKRRAAIAQMLFSRDPSENLKAIRLIDDLRAGRKINMDSLYSPKYSPATTGSLVGQAAGRGN